MHTKILIIVFIITLLTVIGIRNVMAGISLPPQFTSYTNTLLPANVTMGGSLLLLGTCQQQDVTVTGATMGMAVAVNPITDPGAGAIWFGFVKSVNTVTVKICALIAVTPANVTYQIRALP